jgi:hypothetical protein
MISDHVPSMSFMSARNPDRLTYDFLTGYALCISAISNCTSPNNETKRSPVPCRKSDRTASRIAHPNEMLRLCNDRQLQRIARLAPICPPLHLFFLQHLRRRPRKRVETSNEHVGESELVGALPCHTRDLGFGHAHPSLSCSFHCEGSAAIVCRRPCATGPSGTDGASRSGRTSCVGPGEHGWPNMGVSGGPLRQRVEGSRMVMRHMRVLEGFSRLGIMVQHPDGE